MTDPQRPNDKGVRAVVEHSYYKLATPLLIAVIAGLIAWVGNDIDKGLDKINENVTAIEKSRVKIEHNKIAISDNKTWLRSISNRMRGN
jgi:hypothetical protein